MTSNITTLDNPAKYFPSAKPIRVRTMKAAILAELNKGLVVDDVQLPEYLSFGQVLVKVHYSSICGAQINEIEGAKGPDRFLPHLLGHEGSATVVDVGPGVKSVEAGDRVVMHWRPGAGVQAEPAFFQWNDRALNSGWVTTFSEYSIVSENRVTSIPQDFDLRLAPLFGCAVTTGIGLINNDAEVRVGQSVVIFGLGGIGLNIAQAAAMVSAYPIVGIDLYEPKIELAKKFGLSHGINASTVSDVKAAIKAVVGPQGADVVIDTTGNGRVMESAYELSHETGRTVFAGVPRKGDNISIYSLPLYKKLLKASHGGVSHPDVDIPRYIRLVQAGRMKLDGQIYQEFRLDQINEALAAMRQGVAGKCLLSISQ